jgi:hypothetical protein
MGVLSQQNWTVRFAKLGSPIFPDRIELRKSKSSPSSTQKEMGRSSRGFTHRLHLVHLHLLLHDVCETEEGSQTEVGERRMHRPCHHCQSQSR